MTSNSSTLTPTHRTLLLKHGRSTVLLAVLPSTPLLEVKRQLLAVLASRNITTFPSSSRSAFTGSSTATTTTTTESPTTALPDQNDPAALEFGVLVDRKDASRGWRVLNSTSGATSTGNTASRHKQASSKARTASKSGSGTGEQTGTVESAGLADGTWVAYRLKKGRNTDKDKDKDPDPDAIGKGKEKAIEGEDDELDAFAGAGEDDPGWNVVIPTFEEADAAAAEAEAAVAAAAGGLN